MKHSRLLFTAASVMSVAICVAITTVYARKIGYAPDEGSHLSMVEHYGETLRLATWEDMRWGAERGHAYQLFSPLPYLSHVLWWRQARVFGEPQNRKATKNLIRLGGLPIAVLQFWITFLIARLIFRSKWRGLLAALGVNLLPQLRYLHAYINADAASYLAVSFCAWLLLRLIMGERSSGRMAIYVGLALAGLAHSKYNVWMIALPLCAFFITRTCLTVREWPNRLRLIGTSILIPVLLAGWFHLHIYTELGNGHVLAGRDHLELMRSTFDGVTTRPAKNTKGRIRELNTIFTSATGKFVGVGSLPRWYRDTLFAGFLVGTVAVFFAFIRRRTAACRAPAHFYAAGLAVTILTYLSLALQPGLNIQGRLLLGFLPFTPVLPWALNVWIEKVPLCRKHACALLGGFVLFMLLGNILMMRML